MYERDTKTGWSRVYGDNDIETGGGGGAIDYDTAVRNGFIRKVFGILSIQLLLTVAISIPIVTVDSISNYIFNNIWVFYLSLGLSFVFLLSLVCCPGAIHSYPINYVLLFAFTICEGFLVGTISATYDAKSVVLAAGLTLGITIGLSIFATQTKWDFTMIGGILFSILIAMVLSSIIAAFFPASRTFTLIYASIGAILFSAYLVYDVQLIAGGRKYEMGVDDYVPAALAVYLDVINIFLFLLRILGNRS
ncbi:hypothetical protein BSKO_13727 [Bryopsis sp. KO-2023]|nr:hypothetical protein BSKO_13727 [Bryopsis sp. KO-2023]